MQCGRTSVETLRDRRSECDAVGGPAEDNAEGDSIATRPAVGRQMTRSHWFTRKAHVPATQTRSTATQFVAKSYMMAYV